MLYAVFYGGEIGDERKRLETLLGRTAGGAAGAAAAGGRHRAAHPTLSADKTGLPASERRRHPSAEGREPPESAGLHRPHRDDSTRLSAALPECQSELHPCAGSARRADRTLRSGRSRPLRLLPRRRPGPLPGSTSLSSLPARGHPLSRPFAVRSASHRRPVRDAAGGLFGSADRRGAGPHRVQFQCAGHLGPGGRRTAQRDGGHCPARPQSRRPGGGVGRLFPAGAGASARCPAGRPAGPQLEPAHRFDGAGPAHLR